MADDEQKSLVTIYGAEWCPPCHVAKDYLKSKKIDYNYVNVDEDREAGMRIAQQTGWTAIPIIVIGDEHILGFDIAKLNAALHAVKLLT